MPKPKNKPAVAPELAKQWLKRVEEDGDTPPKIAMDDGYDVRTVRKQIEKARQDRERREARFAVFRNALEEHHKDLVSFASRIEEEILRSSISSSVKQDRLFGALRQHTPRSPLWKAINKLDDLNREINAIQKRVEEKLQVKVRAEIVGAEKTEIFPDSIAGAVILRLGIQKEELLPTLKRNPVHEGKTEIRYGGWNCAVGPNYQTPHAEKFVSDLMVQAMVLPESADMRQQLDQRRKVTEAIREELATIKLRRIVPGRCKYCPI